MRRVFTMMWNQVHVTADQLKHWWLTLSPDPSAWVPFTWVLAALVALILLALIVRPRRRPSARRPELLISHGELRFAEGGEAVPSSLRAPDRGAFLLSMTVSNLSAVPVQLLELAVRTNASPAATSAEVPAVLPPHGAVDVSAELREAGGDEGTLELFVYVPDMPPKVFRVRARLLWEPWNARFRVLPLYQKVDALRRLPARGEPLAGASDRSAGRRAAVDRRAYEARFPDAGPEPGVRFEPRPESARPRPDFRGWPEAPAVRREEAHAQDDARRRGSSRSVEPGALWPPPRTTSSEHGRRPDDGSTEGNWGHEGSGAERSEVQRVDPARAELERRAAERKAERDAAERQAAERLEAERQRRIEAVRREAERRAAEQRRAAERVERERLEDERLARERLEKEQAEKERVEKERRARERREAERRVAEQREKARRDKERAERERRAAEQLRDAERDAAEREKIERERVEREATRRDAERALAEREKAKREAAGREKAKREEVERQRAEREKAERDAAGGAQPGRERTDRERADRERTERESADPRAADRARAGTDGSEGPTSGGDTGGEAVEDDAPSKRPKLEFPDEF